MMALEQEGISRAIVQSWPALGVAQAFYEGGAAIRQILAAHSPGLPEDKILRWS